MVSEVDAGEKPAKNKGGRPKGYGKTGGRQKGTPNKATAAKAAEVAASGLTPLDYMLRVLRDEGNDQAVRLDAAKAAAPYVHPKLATVEVKNPDGEDFRLAMSDRDRARRVAFLLEKAMRSKA